MIEAINGMTIRYADDVEKFIDYAKDYEQYQLWVDSSTVSKETDSNLHSERLLIKI